MATFYMSETHPSFLMAESPPGPGWRPAPRTAPPAAPSVPPEPPSVVLNDDPQGEFHRLAEMAAKAKGITLADGYSYVSREAPTLYERAMKAAML